MAILEALKNQWFRDVESLKGTKLKNQNGLEFTFDSVREEFVAVDKTGREWVMGFNSTIPQYWHACDHCNSKHLVPIFYDGDRITCGNCNKISTVKITLPKGASQESLLKDIRKEKKNGS